MSAVLRDPVRTEGGPLVFVIAGEPSGDQLGGRLMAALKRRTGGAVRFAGVGGEQMQAEGLKSLFPISDLAVMGLIEVLPHLPRLLRRIRGTVAAIRETRPDVVVTIDVPGFSYRVGRRLQTSGIPLVHYVAPSVWVWRSGRAAKVAEFLDHMLALLPFEPPYFERHGLACTYVGHPVVETWAPPHGAGGSGEDAAAARPVIAVLPGSRQGEVKRLLPVFGQTLALLSIRHPGLHAVVPTLPGVEAAVTQAAKGWPIPAAIVTSPAERRAALADATVALAASGTVVVELAAAGVPTVVAYRMNPVSAAMVRRLVKVRYASLVNLLLDRPVLPELLQANCRPELLAQTLDQLLTDPAAREAQRHGFSEALQRLRVEGLPSERAAEVVLKVAGAGAQRPRSADARSQRAATGTGSERNASTLPFESFGWMRSQ